MTTLAERLCRHLHPAEWDSPRPRSGPCTVCMDTADAVAPARTFQGQVIHYDPPAARVAPVPVFCPQCPRSRRTRA